MTRKGRPRTKAKQRLDAGIGVLAQIKAAESKSRLSETAQVAAQPHRAWAPDPLDLRLATALGRFVIAYGLRSELFDAGDHYGLIFARWAAAKGIPHPRRSDMIGGGLGPSDATVKAWGRELADIGAALHRYGEAYGTVRRLCIDDMDLPHNAASDTIAGLRAVAVEIGKLPERTHPFLTRPLDRSRNVA